MNFPGSLGLAFLGELTVAGHQTEAIKLACVEQVHGVYDERTARCILTGDVSVLLDRFDGVLLQNFIPGRTSG